MNKSEREYVNALERAIDAHCRGEYVPTEISVLCEKYAEKLDERLSEIYESLSGLQDLVAVPHKGKS